MRLALHDVEHVQCNTAADALLWLMAKRRLATVARRRRWREGGKPGYFESQRPPPPPPPRRHAMANRMPATLCTPLRSQRGEEEKEDRDGNHGLERVMNGRKSVGASKAGQITAHLSRCRRRFRSLSFACQSRRRRQLRVDRTDDEDDKCRTRPNRRRLK